MAVNVGSVVVDLRARNKDVIEGFKQSSSAVSALTKQLSSLQGILLGGAGLAGFAAAVKATVDWAVSLGELNARLGFSTEFLSRMSFAAESSGVKFSELATSMQRFTRRLAEAREGSGTLLSALDALGLDAEKLSQLNADEAFLAWADALSKVEAPGTRAALAMKGMDTEGVKVTQVLAGGAEAMKALREQADALGLTIDSNTAVAAAELSFEMQRVTDSTKGLVTQFTSGLLPALVDTLKAFNDFGSATEGARAVGQAFGNMLNGIRIAAGGVALAVRDTLENILSLNRSAALLLTFDFEGAAKERERFSRVQRQRAIDFIEETNRLAGVLPKFERFVPANRFRQGDERFGRAETDEKPRAKISGVSAMNDAMREANRLLAENARLTEQARSPSEVLADTYADLKNRLDAGGISQRTFSELVRQAQESYEAQIQSIQDSAPRFTEIIEAQLEAAKKGMREIEDQQRAVQRILFGTLNSGLRGFLDKTKSIKEAFSDMIAHITSQLARLAAEEAFGAFFPALGAGRSGGGGFSGFFEGLRGLLPVFATGGSMVVGGAGGTDSQVVSLRATPGERIDVTPAGGSRGGPVVVQHLHFQGRPDPLAAQQVGAATALALRQALVRNG